MAGMSFDHGGRRCIRPILEQYQSVRGKSPTNRVYRTTGNEFFST